MKDVLQVTNVTRYGITTHMVSISVTDSVLRSLGEANYLYVNISRQKWID